MDKNILKYIPYLIFGILLYYFLKPSITFKLNGVQREYGIGYDSNGYKKTLITMNNVIILMVVLIFLFL